MACDLVDSTASLFTNGVCCLPEWSSLTREDTVLVMESAATRRSFLKFLLGPEKRKWDKKKNLTYSTRVHFWKSPETLFSLILTLRKGFLNIAAHAGEGILKRVRVSVRGCSTYRADARWARSRRRDVRGTSCLSLRDEGRTFRGIQFQVLVAADGFYCSKICSKQPFCTSELRNLTPKVQHRGGRLTACRCSSSYRTTAWAETSGKEREGKEEVRHSQSGEIAKGERAEGKTTGTDTGGGVRGRCQKNNTPLHVRHLQ